jgi:hypothetical protein
MRKFTQNTPQNRYPFGSSMASFSNTEFYYSYGMNTQEKDDEIYGAGNSYSAEYWQYDARLGRRWNVDPRPNPSISVYACFGNNPIWFSDVKGDTIKIADPSSESGTFVYSPGMVYDGSDEIISQTVQALNKIHTGPTGKLMIDDLHSMKNSITITRQSYRGKRNYYSSVSKEVGWNPNAEVTVSSADATGNNFENATMDPFLVLGHELGHAWDYNFNKSQSVFGLNPDAEWYSTRQGESVPYSEVFAVHVENQLRLEHGFPLRTHYTLDKDKTGDYLGQLVHTTSTGNFSSFNVRTTTLIQVANPCYQHHELMNYSPMGSEFQEYIWIRQTRNTAFKYD